MILQQICNIFVQCGNFKQSLNCMTGTDVVNGVLVHHSCTILKYLILLAVLCGLVQSILVFL
jgi:hypothetical protein